MTKKWIVWGFVFGFAAAGFLDVSWWRWLAGWTLLRLSNECFERAGWFRPFFRSSNGAGSSPPAADAVPQGRRVL